MLRKVIGKYILKVSLCTHFQICFKFLFKFFKKWLVLANFGLILLKFG